MVSFLDIVSIAIIVFCVIRGAKVGFIKSLFSFFGHIGSLILSFVFCGPLGKYISEIFLDKYFETELSEVEIAEKILKITEGVEINTSEIIGKIIAFVIIYILLSIICFILLKVFTPVLKLPVLKQCNGLLGAVVSFVKSLFIIFILFTAITIFEPFFAETSIYQSGLLNTDNARVFKFMSENIFAALINYFNI